VIDVNLAARGPGFAAIVLEEAAHGHVTSVTKPALPIRETPSGVELGNRNQNLPTFAVRINQRDGVGADALHFQR